MSDPVDFRRLFELAPNAYMLLDRELRYVDANAAYLAVTSVRKEDLVGRYIFDVFPDPENGRLLKDSFERVFATRAPDILALVRYRVPQKLPDGRLKVRLGARVLVTIEALNTTARHAVAIVDPLPAGLEAVNVALATAERAAISPTPDARWDYRNMRDNRSEAFAMNLDEGTHRFSYTARATTPGTFIAAPSKAEEMYSPETFGRSSEQTIVIE